MKLTIEIDQVREALDSQDTHVQWRVTAPDGTEYLDAYLCSAVSDMIGDLPMDAFYSPQEKLQRAYAAGKVMLNQRSQYHHVRVGELDLYGWLTAQPAFDEPEEWEVAE